MPDPASQPAQTVTFSWAARDVQRLRPDLTEAQAHEVLTLARARYDPREGVNWNVLTQHAQTLFPSEPGRLAAPVTRPGSLADWAPPELRQLCEAQAITLYLLTEWNREGRYDGQAVAGARDAVRALGRGLITEALTYLQAQRAASNLIEETYDEARWDAVRPQAWATYRAMMAALGEPVPDED